MSKLGLHGLKTKLQDFIDVGIIMLQHRSEIRKSQDPRRRAIYEKVQLTGSQERMTRELFEENYRGGVYPIPGTDTIRHSPGSLM